MKLKAFLDEMTLKANSLDADLSNIFNHLKQQFPLASLQHVGDIDNVQVMRHTSGSKIIDLLYRAEHALGFMSGELLAATKFGELLTIQQWYITTNEQRQDLGYKYLYFLKNVLNHKLLLGDVHTRATRSFIAKQSRLTRFRISWCNLVTGEQEPFDKDSDKYSFTKATDWQVLIEADNRRLFDQYKSDMPSIYNTYAWLFDGIED